jgi:uncharacterized membrane protein YciS (DUF1049 family)
MIGEKYFADSNFSLTLVEAFYPVFAINGWIIAAGIWMRIAALSSRGDS